MNFRPELAAKVMAGDKTVTRRLVSDNPRSPRFRERCGFRAALIVQFAAKNGWIEHDAELLTTGIRDTYLNGLGIALPTAKDQARMGDGRGSGTGEAGRVNYCVIPLRMRRRDD